MKEKIEQNIPLIFKIFLYSNPILDMLIYLCLTYLKVSISIGMIVRFGGLLVLLLLLFWNKEHQKEKIGVLLSFFYFLFFLLFVFLQKGEYALFYEAKGLFRTFYLPILLLCLHPYKNKLKEQIHLRDIVFVYTIYLGFILLPNLLGVGHNAYLDSKEGSIGFFYSANEIGAILSILMPFVMCFFLKEKKYLGGTIYLVFTLFTLFQIGTKVPILSFGMVSIGFFFFYFIQTIRKKQYVITSALVGTLVLLCTLFFLFLPKTTFYKNLKIHMDYLGMKSITEVFTNYHNLDHFVFSERLSLLMESKELYDKASSSTKLFGLGYIRNISTDQVSTKIVEMDYYDIFYCHGIIGCTLFFFLIFSFFWKSKNFLTWKDSLLKSSFLLSFFLIFSLSFFAGHILVSPAVSFYVACILLIGGTYEESKCHCSHL